MTTRSQPTYGGAGSKIPLVSVNRDVAQIPSPASETGQTENRISIYTYFTSDGPADVLYNGDRMWARVVLTLETAGPVAVGNQSSISPVLTGKGQLLETDVPTAFDIAKGSRLYIAATGVNRVKVVLEAHPWLEVITGLIGKLIGIVGGGGGAETAPAVAARAQPARATANPARPATPGPRQSKL